jgi:diaminopimelate epimerase
MEQIFYKYQGTGNDFILIDDRNNILDISKNNLVKSLCDRRFGIGADGLIIMRSKDGFDFEMVYFNADGNVSTMCGNGGRCMVQFAYDLGLHKSIYKFLAIDGEHTATIDTNKIVRLQMQDVLEVEEVHGHYILNTGSPHFIKMENNVAEIDVAKDGAAIRYSKEFEAKGINVNFVENTSSYSIYVRTYERGVEAETLSCGTGVTAAALVNAHNENGFNEVRVKTNGGNLSVEFNKHGPQNFTDIFLCGPATFVFKGFLNWN